MWEELKTKGLETTPGTRGERSVPVNVKTDRMLGNTPDNGVKVNTKDSTTIPLVSGGRVEDEAATNVEEMTAMLALKVVPLAKEEAPPPSKAVKIPGNEL